MKTKKIIAFVLVALFIFAIPGCGSQGAVDSGRTDMSDGQAGTNGVNSGEPEKFE